MAVTPLATGRGAQVVTDPVSDARQAIRGAYANTMEENLAFIADSIAAGDLADGYTPDGTTLTGLDANNYVIANAPIAGGGSTVDEAPTTGLTYGRRSTAWTPVIPTTGGAYTGPITLPGSPTLAQQATTKAYVDQAIANSQLNQGTWQVAANVPDLIAAVPTNLDGYTWTAQTVDPLVGEVAPAIPGISGRTINAGDTVRWNGPLATYELIQGAGLTQATADQRYVNTAGDTLTGPLVLAADPANPLEAATKQYTDAADALLTSTKVAKAGDTMTGPLILSADPTAPLDAASKNYVDSRTGTGARASSVLPAGNGVLLTGGTTGYSFGKIRVFSFYQNNPNSLGSHFIVEYASCAAPDTGTIGRNWYFKVTGTSYSSGWGTAGITSVSFSRASNGAPIVWIAWGTPWGSVLHYADADMFNCTVGNGTGTFTSAQLLATVNIASAGDHDQKFQGW